ncbi:MAG: hypothetical protein Q9220_000095 [cf. Caloplaca sp. 1 TL-2023]
MSTTSEALEAVLRAFEMIRPMLPTYLHLIVSALLPIYAGAHASLTRPKSAAKPSKSQAKSSIETITDDDAEEETESKVEGLSASDAIWFPVLAGCTLGGLYLIIKWLQDPTLLNTILNWYFAIFGIVGVARMFNDTLDVLSSYIFPSSYSYDGQVWKFDTTKRLAISQKVSSQTSQSPFPGIFRHLPIPNPLTNLIWTLRSNRSTLCIRTHLHPRKTHIHLSPTTIFGYALALTTVLYYNLVSRPWYLTNTLGLAFAYNALQLISPTTSTTGTLILTSLFAYDIYFVFYTPLMVTVATQLDIPAKLLFPRPSSAGDKLAPGKQQLSMLGLGDVVLPGMMIGFALRMDLYLFYLYKQTHKSVMGASSSDLSETIHKSPDQFAPDPASSTQIIIKSPFRPATGNWGTRFWSPSSDEGYKFPKPYFRATMVGYVIGMIMTLGVMHVFNHAQPALLYLVPCVLVSFWGTAMVRGEVREVWGFDEGEDEEEKTKKEKDEKGTGEGKEEKKEKGKKKMEEAAEKQRGSTDGVDFLALDIRLAWSKSKGVNGCASGKVSAVTRRSSRRKTSQNRESNGAVVQNSRKVEEKEA